MTPPEIEFKVDKTKVGTINKPVYHMITAWFNQVRKFRVAYDDKKKKYQAVEIFMADLVNNCVFGINTSLLKDQGMTIRCEFKFEPVDPTLRHGSESTRIRSL